MREEKGGREGGEEGEGGVAPSLGGGEAQIERGEEVEGVYYSCV